MRKYLVFVLTVLSVLAAGSASAYAQGRFRERLREKVREAWFARREGGVSGENDRLFSLEHDGIKRQFQVHLPSTYDEDMAMPVVIYLHGGGGSMRAAYRDGVDKASEKFGFILVMPAGTGPLPDRLLTWNGGKWTAGKGGPGAESCCGYAARNDIDDVGFISKMIEEVKKNFRVDERRVYATGISNGGIMAYRLACELSDKIVAIAPVAPPAVPADCSPSRPVAVMHIHGTADPCAPYGGGTGGGCLGREQYEMQSAKEMTETWKGLNGCSADSVVRYAKGMAVCAAYTQCRGNADVELCAVEGMGHAWPGGVQYLRKERVGSVSYDISFDQIWDFFKTHPSPTAVSTASESDGRCGDGLCDVKETKSGCPADCDRSACNEIYDDMEQQCLQSGWQKLYVTVNGVERDLMYKGPGRWEHGAIIVMHGGGGADSNVCSSLPQSGTYRFLSDILRGVPMREFAESAVQEGFAVFSLDSTYNRVTDGRGLSAGKRWDCLAQKGKENIDLPFIEKVMAETIPSLRPQGSSDSIFMTGISNGGFMTILAATHLGPLITAFAPVSSGDPYGAYFDMSTHPRHERKCAPGVWRDSETDRQINWVNACAAQTYANEALWASAGAGIPFRQFHNTGDAACDISCMRKVERLLVEHGCRDEGAFVINSGRRSVESHFWQREYNGPLLEFFKKHSSFRVKEPG